MYYYYFLCYIYIGLEEKDKNIKSPTMSNKLNTEPDVVLTRTHSFETDEK